MLTYDDASTIDFAVKRRLDTEPGVRRSWVEIIPALDATPPFLHVVVTADMGDLVGLVTSLFDLPVPFEHRHLLNEIDEVAEGVKKARHDFFRNGMQLKGLKDMGGTGLRGRWAQYG